MRQQVCNKNNYVMCGLDHAVDVFQSSAKGTVDIFTNSKKKCFLFVDSLENKIDEAKMAVHVDILHIHRSLLNTEKFWHANICSLVGTNAVNVGIDDNLIELVI